MNPVLKKKLDEVVAELAKKKYQSTVNNEALFPISEERWKSFYALVAQQAILMAKLAILGASAKDKNINIKESCQLMMVDASAFAFHGIAILGAPIEDVQPICDEVDAAVLPLLQQMFGGPVPGKDLVN